MPEDIQDTPLSGAKAMVVEDAAPMRRLIVKALSKAGASVHEAENGRQALSELRAHDTEEHPFSLAFMDIMMPVMDGIQALTEIRQDPELSGLPVLMISATEERAHVVACARLGVQGFLKKPLQINKLIETAAEVLKQNGLRQKPVAVAAGGARQAEGDIFTHALEKLPEQNSAVLRVSGHLDDEARYPFKKAVGELLECGMGRLAIDMSQRVRITSNLYMGTLVDAGEKALTSGGELTVIMTQEFANVCRQKGMAEKFRITIAR